MLALLTGAYLCLALIVSLFLWRMGATPAVGVSAFIGMLGLCFAFHGLLAQTFLGAALRMDIDTVREAHAILHPVAVKKNIHLTLDIEDHRPDADAPRRFPPPNRVSAAA